MKKMCLAALAAILCGCTAIPLLPQAQNVKVSSNIAPRGCKYLGQVEGNQGNFLTGSWTSNQNLEEGAMHDLKNRAHKLGANYVHLIVNRAGNTGSYGSAIKPTKVTSIGNAYACPITPASQ